MEQLAGMVADELGQPQARFVLLTDLPTRVSRPATVAVPKQVTWRLVAANNRSIGKAVSVFETVADCVADTVVLTEGIARVAGSVLFHPDTTSASSSYWAWSVTLDSHPAAASTHRYLRRIECERALRHFIAAVRTSEPASAALRRLGQRLGAGPA